MKWAVQVRRAAITVRHHVHFNSDVFAGGINGKITTPDSSWLSQRHRPLLLGDSKIKTTPVSCFWVFAAPWSSTPKPPSDVFIDGAPTPFGWNWNFGGRRMNFPRKKNRTKPGEMRTKTWLSSRFCLFCEATQAKPARGGAWAFK